MVGDSGVDAHAHRGVRAAALPLGHGEHHVHAALGRGDVLAGDVAVRGRDHRAGAVLALAAHAGRGGRPQWPGRLPVPRQRGVPRADGRGLSQGHPRGAQPPADASSAPRCAGRGRGADLSDDQRRADAADRRGRGQRQRRARRRHARRAHRGGAAAARGDGQEPCPRRRRSSPTAAAAATTASAAAAAAGRPTAVRSASSCVPRDQRTRTNEEISMDLRRTAGRPAGRRSSGPTRPAATSSCSGCSAADGDNQDARLALEIRGHDLDDARRVAVDAQQRHGSHAGPRRRAHRPRRRAGPKSRSASIGRRPPCSA